MFLSESIECAQLLNSYHIESLEVQFKNLAFIFYKGYCSGIAIHGFNRTEEELISVFRNNRKGVRADYFKHTYFDIGFFSKHTFSYSRKEDNYFEKYRTYFLTGHFYTSESITKQYLNPHSHDKSKKIDHHPELIEKVHNKIYDFLVSIFKIPNSPDSFYESFRIESE